jgi:hypothetical protein
MFQRLAHAQHLGGEVASHELDLLIGLAFHRGVLPL